MDNNLTERQLRPMKAKPKVIGGFRAVWETTRLNGRYPFETLGAAFAA